MMAVSIIKEIFPNDRCEVWNIVLDIDKYSQWRSDVSKVEIIDDNQFIEYNKSGYATIFTVTNVESYQKWEFDMENTNMKGHWIGIFTSVKDGTQIEFIEDVKVKKRFYTPFLGFYLKKQQRQFIFDLKKMIDTKKTG